MDYYTNAATPLHDAYLFFPMMYNHFPEALPWDPKDFSFASSFHASFLFSINQFLFVSCYQFEAQGVFFKTTINRTGLYLRA